MQNYTKKTVEKIAGVIRQNLCSVADVCQSAGIDKESFYSWMWTKKGFSDAIEKAVDEFFSMIMSRCEELLIKRKGKHTTSDPNVRPDDDAVVFTLRTDDPNRLKLMIADEGTGKDQRIHFEGLSDEQLDQTIKDMEMENT